MLLHKTRVKIRTKQTTVTNMYTGILYYKKNKKKQNKAKKKKAKKKKKQKKKKRFDTKRGPWATIALLIHVKTAIAYLQISYSFLQYCHIN